MSCPEYVRRYAESEGYGVAADGDAFRLRNLRTDVAWPVAHPTRTAAWDAFDRALRRHLGNDTIRWLAVTRFDPNRRVAQAGHFEVSTTADGIRWDNALTGDRSDATYADVDAAWADAAAEAALHAVDHLGASASDWAELSVQGKVDAVRDAYDRTLNLRP